MDVSGFIPTCGNIIMTAMLLVMAPGYQVESLLDKAPTSITVTTGGTAVLPCQASPKLTEAHGDMFRVVWVNPATTAISIQDRRIINDQRISVERPFLPDWNLHIRNVSLTDAGLYKCQINTNPIGTKNVTLVVHEPPHIIDYSKPQEVRTVEKGAVELFCNASGFPEPNITWFRMNTDTSGRQEKVGNVGNSLVIKNISRMCADSYMCVASNNVEPSDTKIFTVRVLYAPEVHMPNTRLGQEVGRDTVLECEVKASPLAVVAWKFNNKRIVSDSHHELTLYDDNERSITLNLRLLKIKPESFGMYECEANNKLGYKSDYMELYEVKKKTTTTTTTTTTPRYDWNSENRNTYRGKSRGENVNGNSRNQGLIWTRQEKNNQEPPYSSSGGKNGRTRTRPGNKESKMNSREPNGYTGMRSRTGNNDGGSATSLIASFVVLTLSLVSCHTAVHSIGR